MSKQVVILSREPDSEKIRKFEEFLRREFSDVNVERKLYDREEVPVNCVVFCDYFFPTIACRKKVRDIAQDNRRKVFIFSPEGLKDSDGDLYRVGEKTPEGGVGSGGLLGLEGVVYKLRIFEAFTKKDSGLAKEVLRKYLS